MNCIYICTEKLKVLQYLLIVRKRWQYYFLIKRKMTIPLCYFIAILIVNYGQSFVKIHVEIVKEVSGNFVYQV